MANRKFSELRANMPASARAEVRARADELLREMALGDLRRAYDLTQQDLAKRLNVNQAWISKFERKTDMYLSTLRAYVKAVGGELDLIARFGDGSSVRINDLHDLGTLPAPATAPAAAHNAAPNASEQPSRGMAMYPNPPGHSIVAGVPGRTTTRSNTPDARTTSSTTSRAA